MLKWFRAPEAAAAAALTAFLGFALFASGAVSADSQPETGVPSAASTFKANCAVCHGANGAGSSLGKSLHAPNLHSNEVQRQSSAAMAEVISQGKGVMPAFGSRFDQKQIDGLVKYVRHFHTAGSGNAK